jgi:hypothetical protein
MKYVYWAVGVLFSLALLVGGLQWVASERVEVVDLLTTDEAGEPVTTRLWMVDDGGYQYLRVGADGSGWFSRIQANGEFQVTRNGSAASYTAVLRQDKSQKINDLMQEKYSWGDSLIGVLAGSREGSIPVELHASN